jgi:hypothetical protein
MSVLKPEVREKWVAALRSGEYTQGTRALNRDGKFCCLGILCDLYHKETGQGAWIVQPYIGDDKTLAFTTNPTDPDAVSPITGTRLYTNHGMPPLKVWDWAFASGDSQFYGTNLPDTSEEAALLDLANMNDKGATFTKIADFIETKNL